MTTKQKLHTAMLLRYYIAAFSKADEETKQHYAKSTQISDTKHLQSALQAITEQLKEEHKELITFLNNE